mmetsp:Transcript_63836/g.177475  ORF Transcript_63836/g.177475 Transcript_63836/m.177475 type:complete len:202 (+) Transcript_63836:413-1018(+)
MRLCWPSPSRGPGEGNLNDCFRLKWRPSAAPLVHARAAGLKNCDELAPKRLLTSLPRLQQTVPLPQNIFQAGGRRCAELCAESSHVDVVRDGHGVQILSPPHARADASLVEGSLLHFAIDVRLALHRVPQLEQDDVKVDRDLNVAGVLGPESKVSEGDRCLIRYAFGLGVGPARDTRDTRHASRPCLSMRGTQTRLCFARR